MPHYLHIISLRIHISPSSLEATPLLFIGSFHYHLTLLAFRFSGIFAIYFVCLSYYCYFILSVSQFKSRAQLTMWRCPLLASGTAEMAEAEKEGVSQTQRNKKRLRENSLAEAQTSCLLWPSWGTALTFIPCRNSTGLRFLLYNSQPTWTYNTCKYELALNRH